MANDGSVIIDIEGDSSKFKSALSGLGSIASTALKGVTTAVAAANKTPPGVAGVTPRRREGRFWF